MIGTIMGHNSEIDETHAGPNDVGELLRLIHQVNASAANPRALKCLGGS